MVISWLINSLTKEIATSVLSHDSAFAIWKDLEERFLQRNGPRIFQLKKSLAELSQGNLSVTTYFTKLKSIWDELCSSRSNCSCGNCSCGGVSSITKESQDDYVMQFLIGLHESFAQVRSQILLMDPLPSINKAFSLVVQDERQREISLSLAPTDQSIALAIRNSNNHSNTKKPRPQCTHCHFPGHLKDRCYKLHGYLPGYLRSKPSDHSRNSNSSSTNIVQESTPTSTSIMDSFTMSTAD